MGLLKNCTTFLIIMLATAISVRASDTLELERALRADLVGKVFILRGFPTDENLNFDANFSPTHEIHSGPWTTANLQIQNVQVTDKEIKISGERIGLIGASDGFQQTELNKHIEIRIGGPFPPESLQVLDKIRTRLFITDDNEMAALVPDFWKPYFKDRISKRNEGMPKGKSSGGPETSQNKPSIQSEPETKSHETIYKVNYTTIMPPQAIDQPAPEYPELARLLKFQGTTLLALVIGKDGLPSHIRVKWAVGLGLDDAAYEAVQKWKFRPATKDGEPVAVAVDVSVKFDLH